MATSGDLVQEGIDAFKAGDKARALQLLSEAVKQPENKTNEQAWYYLAAAQTDPTRRKQALEVVLKINPDNERAQEALAKVSAQLAESGAAAPSRSEIQEKPKRKITPSGEVDIAPPASGFKLPVDIPDAPEFVDISYIINLFIQIFKNGLDILQKKEGAYEAELNRATWWRFWVYLGVGSVLIALLAMVGSFWGFYRAVVIAILYLIFTIPITLITYYGSAYISHSYAKSAGGQGALVHHSYVALVPGLTAGIIGAVLNAIPFVNIVGWIIAIILSLYALFIMVDGFEMIHGYERNKGWITAAVMVLAQILIGGVLGGILGSIIASIYFSMYFRLP